MKKRLFLILTLFLLATIIVGCGSDPKPVPTQVPTAEATKAPTQAPTTAPTQAPTQAPEGTPSADPGVELGVPNEGAFELFCDNFEGSGQILHDEAVTRYKFGYEVKENEFIFNTQYANFYMPNIMMPMEKDLLQYEIYMTFSTNYPDTKEPGKAWFCPYIGVRVYDLGEGYNPQHENSGLWIRINDTKTAKISHGLVSQWPDGGCEVALPEDFTTEHTLTIIDVQGVIYYYMNTAEKDRVLICKVDITGANLIVYDAAGEKIYEAENNLLYQEGYFKVFNHFGDTVISNVTIKDLYKK